MVKFIREMVRVIVDQALMPTGKNLVPTIYFAGGITIMEILFELLNTPHILNWQGCLLSVVVLCVILVLERSEYNAVSKLYRDAELCAKNLKERQQAARASFKDARTVSVSQGTASDNARGTNQ